MQQTDHDPLQHRLERTRRGLGDLVTAGTVSTDSGLRIEVFATGEDTALAGIRRLVEQAQNSTSHAQRLADRAAALLFWFALIAAAITGITWTLLGEPMSLAQIAGAGLVLAGVWWVSRR